MKCAVTEVAPTRKVEVANALTQPLPVTAPLQQRIGALLQSPQPHPQAPQLKAPPQSAKLRLNTPPQNNVAANISRALSAVATVTPPPYRLPLLGAASVLTAWSASQFPALTRFQVTDPWPLNEGYSPHPNGPVAHVQPDGSEVKQPPLGGKLTAPQDITSGSQIPGRTIHDKPPPAEGRDVLPPPQAKDFILMSEGGNKPSAKHSEWMGLSIGREIDPSKLQHGALGNEVEVTQLDPGSVQASVRMDTPEGGYRFSTVQVVNGVAVVSTSHEGGKDVPFNLPTELKYERDMQFRLLAELNALDTPVLEINAVLPTTSPDEHGVHTPSANTLISEFSAARGATTEERWHAAVKQLPISKNYAELNLRLDRVQVGEDYVVATYRHADGEARQQAQSVMQEMRNPGSAMSGGHTETQPTVANLKNSTIAFDGQGSFTLIGTLQGGAFGNGTVKGRRVDGKLEINLIEMRPQGYDPHFLTEGISGTDTQDYAQYIVSDAARQHEQAMIEQVVSAAREKSKALDQVVVTLPFDLSLGANSSSSAHLIQALHEKVGSQPSGGDAAYYLDNDSSLQQAIETLPVSQALNRSGLRLDHIETVPSDGVVKLAFRPQPLGQGIADHAGAPQWAQVRQITDQARVQFDPDQFSISTSGPGATHRVDGGLEYGRLMYRHQIKVPEDIGQDYVKGGLGGRAFVDQVLEDSESAFFAQTVHEAQQKGQPIHEVFTSFKPKAGLDDEASFSSMALRRRLQEQGLSADALPSGLLDANHPVAVVVKELPFSKLMQQYGLEVTSVVNSGPAGLSVTYEYADQAKRAAYQNQAKEALALDLQMYQSHSNGPIQ